MLSDKDKIDLYSKMRSSNMMTTKEYLILFLMAMCCAIFSKFYSGTFGYYLIIVMTIGFALLILLDMIIPTDFNREQMKKDYDHAINTIEKK
jgi:hypothetical protein